MRRLLLTLGVAWLVAAPAHAQIINGIGIDPRSITIPVVVPASAVNGAGISQVGLIAPQVCLDTANQDSGITRLGANSFAMGTCTVGDTSGVLRLGTVGVGVAPGGVGTITASGLITGSAFTASTGNVLVGSGQYMGSANKGIIQFPNTDGVIDLLDNAGTGFTRLILGTNDGTANGASLVLTGGDLFLAKGDGSGSGSSVNFNVKNVSVSGGYFAGSGTTLTATTVGGVGKVLFAASGTGATQVASTQPTPPTCSLNCGTSVPTEVGTDSDMIITMGSAGAPASGFVVTFNGTWAAVPSCTGTMAKAGMVVGKLPLVIVAATTTMTVTTNGTAPATSDVYAFHCRGVQ